MNHMNNICDKPDFIMLGSLWQIRQKVSQVEFRWNAFNIFLIFAEIMSSDTEDIDQSPTFQVGIFASTFHVEEPSYL